MRTAEELSVELFRAFSKAVRERDRLQAERDAAVRDMEKYPDCRLCYHYGYEQCPAGVDGHCWQWRGVQEETE